VTFITRRAYSPQNFTCSPLPRHNIWIEFVFDQSSRLLARLEEKSKQSVITLSFIGETTVIGLAS
jgi:hypothetical protein